MRIVQKLQGSCGYSAVIRSNPEYEEHVVQYLDDGKLLPESCWSYCPPDESADTAAAELRFMSNRRVLTTTLWALLRTLLVTAVFAGAAAASYAQQDYGGSLLFGILATLLGVAGFACVSELYKLLKG